MAKEVWFSNYFDAYDEEEIRNNIFDDEYSRELYGWETPEDIDDELVYDEINIYQEEDFDAFKYDFGKYIDSTPYGLVLSGSAGRWNGNYDGGMFIDNFNDLLDFWKDCVYIKVYSENKHLYVQGTHHDRTNYGELPRFNGF